jgi:4-amino-4-deoxy-L-arabinose transferase-like glycosyltransferase
MTVEKQAGGDLKRLWMLLPIVLAALVYLISTTSRGVIDYDEGYYAQAALHMAKSGDWVTPYANGVRFLEKPPLLYWVTAVSFRLFGINEFALRLPTALAMIAVVWIVMLIARRASNERTALIAGLSTAFSAGAFLFTRETLHDVWLVLFISLAVYAFIEWHLDPRHPARPALLFYGAMAGAVLCKSLVGMAFPVGIVAAFFLLSRERPAWRSLHLAPGILLFLIITAPWHWLAAVRNQGFLNFFFVGEQFLRFFGKREPPVLWSMPLWTFWVLILVWLFPWTPFLPAAFTASRKPAEEHARMPGHARMLVRLAIAWAGVILLFFSISGRLEHYAFPALPALSLLIAAALSQSGESKTILWGFRVLAILGILVVLIGGAGIWYIAVHGFQSTESGPSNRLAETDFSILAEMPSSVVLNLLKPAALTCISLATGFMAALWFEMHRRRIHAVISVAVVMIAVCGAIHWSLTICEDLISSKKFAIAVAQNARPGDRLVVVDDYESANSLNFYAPLHVEVFAGTAYALIPGMKYPDATKIVLTQQEFQSAWESPLTTVFALVPKDKLKDLNISGIEMMSLLHRVLIRNH